MMNILLRRIAILLSLLLIAGTVSQASGADGTSVVSVATIKYPNGDSYVGNIDDNGLRNGKGIYEWVNGDVYEGDWLENKRHGRGKSTYANVGVYVGKYEDGLKNGKGKFTCANGDVYVGQFKDGRKNGHGKYTWANGNVYDGDWLADKIHGKGKFTYANGEVYVGEYKDGLRNGKGIYEWVNGNVYDGDWLANKRHGKGKLTWANGNVYVGEYRNCLRNGKGKFTWTNGAVYVGEFLDGLRNGLGTDTSMWKVRRYQGEWSNDKMHGKGAMSWFGNLIEVKGEWKNGWLNSIVRVRVDIGVLAFVNRLIHAICSHAVHYFNHVLVLAVWTIFWRFLWEFLFRNKEPTVGVGVIRVEREGTGDTDLVVRLNRDHSHCGICYEAFATDMEATDQTSQNLLPVMGPCGHYFCRGCIIARDHHAPNGAKGCPMCNRADQFDPDNLVHHRMLIDLLQQRARPTGAAPADEEA